MAKAKVINDGPTLKVPIVEGKSRSRQLTEAALCPMTRNGTIVGFVGGKHFGGEPPSLNDTIEVMANACEKVRGNDLGDQKDILTSQAMALDTMFTILVSRSEANIEHHLNAAERFMRLALKAQTQCRTTIEALDRLARGGEQVIKHVHV